MFHSTWTGHPRSLGLTSAYFNLAIVLRNEKINLPEKYLDFYALAMKSYLENSTYLEIKFDDVLGSSVQYTVR